MGIAAANKNCLDVRSTSSWTTAVRNVSFSPLLGAVQDGATQLLMNLPHNTSFVICLYGDVWSVCAPPSVISRHADNI